MDGWLYRTYTRHDCNVCEGLKRWMCNLCLFVLHPIKGFVPRHHYEAWSRPADSNPAHQHIKVSQKRPDEKAAKFGLRTCLPHLEEGADVWEVSCQPKDHKVVTAKHFHWKKQNKHALHALPSQQEILPEVLHLFWTRGRFSVFQHDSGLLLELPAREKNLVTSQFIHSKPLNITGLNIVGFHFTDCGFWVETSHRLRPHVGLPRITSLLLFLVHQF